MLALANLEYFGNFGCDVCKRLRASRFMLDKVTTRNKDVMKHFLEAMMNCNLQELRSVFVERVFDLRFYEKKTDSVLSYIELERHMKEGIGPLCWVVWRTNYKSF